MPPFANLFLFRYERNLLLIIFILNKCLIRTSDTEASIFLIGMYRYRMVLFLKKNTTNVMILILTLLIFPF